MIITRSFEGLLLSHLAVHHVMGKVLHASKPSRDDVNPLPSSYYAQDSLPVSLRVRGTPQATAPGAPGNPALGCCWDAASWGLQEHLCEPCHENSGSPWKSLEMNSKIMRKGRILTSWSSVTAVKGQRGSWSTTRLWELELQYPESQCFRSCFTQPHAQLTPRISDQ